MSERRHLPILSYVALLWQVPLSVASWSVQRVLRALFLWGAAAKARRACRSGEAPRWRGLSEVLREPLARWFVMMVGPRWNCHAVLADLGPIKVERSLQVLDFPFSIGDRQYSIVVYDVRYRIAGYIANAAEGAPGQERLLRLAPGIYRISARFYGFSPGDRYPAIRIDDRVNIADTSIGTEDFQYQEELKKLGQHRSALMYFLHAHVYHMLRWRRLLGESLVRRLFVPVGNPATQFFYAPIRRGQSLVVTRAEPLAGGDAICRVFVAVYNRCSLPVFWSQVTGGIFQSEPAAQHGYFLIRVVAPSASTLTHASELLRWRYV